MKDKILYAIVDPRGDINLHTLRIQKKMCIESWVRIEDWKTAKKSGFKCVKFKVGFSHV